MSPPQKSSAPHTLRRHFQPVGNRSLVVQVAEDIVRWLQAEQVAAGTRLLSVREMAVTRRVSADTVARAYDKLVALGHLEARRGSGFYVRSQRRQLVQAASFSADWDSKWGIWRGRLLHPELPPERWLGIGRLPNNWIDEALLERALRQAARTPASKLLSYGATLGLLPLREQIDLLLAGQNIHAGAEGIVTTRGATDAIDLVLQAFSPTTAQVLIEDPCPFVLLERLAASNIGTLTVSRQEDGPDLAQLRQLCTEHQPRLFFCSSLLHNPTSSSLSPQKAFQLLKLAEEFDLLLVDDDSYADLASSHLAARHVRLASMDQLQRVIHIGSFTKLLGAGLRVGFIASNKDRTHSLSLHKSALGIANCELPERVALHALTDGAYRHQGDQIRAKLDRRREEVLKWLGRCDFKVWHEADQGLFLWADMGAGHNAMVLAEDAFQQGLLLAPGFLFTTEERWGSFLRFNIASPFREGDLRRLAELRDAAKPA